MMRIKTAASFLLEVRALEKIANQPTGPSEKTCERDWINPGRMN
jgi:hypothetical protein